MAINLGGTGTAYIAGFVTYTRSAAADLRGGSAALTRGAAAVDLRGGRAAAAGVGAAAADLRSGRAAAARAGTATAVRLMLELLLRLTVGAVELFERETAADWLLLVVLPPCERLRPWAIASDALKIRHPMRAKLIMMVLTEVFIIVLY